MSRLLRLLPSRPDRVHKVSLREDQRPTIEAAHYEQHSVFMQVVYAISFYAANTTLSER